MAIFKSPTVIINKTAEEVFNKFSNLNNMRGIMPSQIEEFDSNNDWCSLKMKGLPKLELEINKRVPYSEISLIAKESQIAFSLNCYITEKKEDCEVLLEINAELNMMMQMMVEKPLKQLLNTLANKMQNI